MELVGLLLIVAGIALTVGWSIGMRMGQDSERGSQGFPKSRRFHR